MTQISAQTEHGPQLLKTYSNARKLLQVREQPVGVMTYGLGNVGKRSIEGLVLDFNRTDAATATTVAELTQGLYDLVVAQYNGLYAETDKEQRPALGFYVAGYSEGQPFPEEFEFLLPRDPVPFPARADDQFGASWRGIDVAFTRIYKGLDPTILPWRRGHQAMKINKAVDTRRWAQTSPSPAPREQPNPLSPPPAEDGRPYGQTTEKDEAEASD